MFVRDFSGDNVFFERFSLRKGADRHGECRFRALMDESKVRDCLDRVGQQLYVAREEDQDIPVFCGVIDRVGMEGSIAGTALELVARSASSALDESGAERIFQNPEKTYGDILESLDLGKCGLELEDKFKNSACKPVVLQWHEPDFAFLLRMAEAEGRRLWVNDRSEERTTIKIGRSLSQNTRQIARKDIIRLLETRSASGRCLRLDSLLGFEPGSLISLEGDSRVYLILAYHLSTVHGNDIFTYKLAEFSEKDENKAVAKPQTAILRARVADNQDPENRGRVRLNFEDLEDECPADKKLWLPFRPVWAGKAGGTVFVPDKDDLLEAFFVDGELYATSTLRENPLQEECRQVTDKYIGNNSGQRIFWKEKSLEFMSAENKIYMDDEKVEISVGDKLIRLDKDGILLQSPRAKISLDANGLVCHTEGDIKNSCDGAWRLESKGETSIQSRSDTKINAASAHIQASGTVNIGKRVKLGN